MSDLLERLKSALTDRYAIEREIGRGGMAVVYLAEDVRHSRKVAIKVLRPELAASLGADRFLREIQIVAGLTHPHVLPLHDSGQSAGFLYYVMPFIEGETLRDRLDREQVLPLEDVQRITAEVASALEFAHDRGLIHRDIKPGNILLSGGHAVVADFGLARAVEQSGREKLTRSGLGLGTPGYCSPEQAFGEGVVDGRTDIFSLGVVAYEMLCGEPPFTGSTTRAILARMTTETPTSLRALRETIPEHVETAVMRALAKLPADRFSKPSEFAAAMTGEAVREPGRRSPSGGIVGSVKEALKRSPALNRAAGAALAVVLLGSAAWLIPGMRGESAGSGRVAASAIEPGTINRIGVLPFSNLTGDEANDAPIDALQIDLINRLHRIGGGLVVLSGLTMEQFRGSSLGASGIADSIGVDALVEGSVTQADGQLRLSIQLTAADHESSLFANTYTRRRQELQFMLRDVSQEIASELRLVLSPQDSARLADAHVVNDSAYKLFIAGNRYMSHQDSAGTRNAIDRFERALEQDSAYAEAHSRLAFTHFNRPYVDGTPTSEAFPAAEFHARRAIELDSLNASAYATLGTIRCLGDFDFVAADSLYAKAVEANPGGVHHQYGFCLAWLGRFDESLAYLRRATEIAPELGIAQNWLIAALRLSGRLDEALSLAEEHAAQSPHGMFAQGRLAAVYEALDRFDDAIRVLVELEHGDALVIAKLHALAGREAIARGILAAELAGERADEPLDPMNLASLYLALGDTATTFEWLDRALEERNPNLITLNAEASWEPIRSDARFKAILSQIGFPGM